MKKIKLGLAAVLGIVVLYIGATWFVGMRAQSTLMETVDRTNQQLVQYVGGDLTYAAQLEIVDYQRGVFSSTAQYVLRLPDTVRYALDLPTQDDDITLQMQGVIQHGPLPWQNLLQGDFSPVLVRAQQSLVPTTLTQFWFDLAGGQPLQIDTRITFSRDLTATMTFAPITGSDDLQFSGGQMTIQSSNFDNTHANGSFASLAYTDHDSKVQLHDLSVAAQGQSRDDVVQGESSFNVARFTIVNPDENVVDMENFRVSGGTELRDGLLNVDVRYQIGNLKATGRNLGAFEMGLHGKRVNLAALYAMVQPLANMGHPDMDDEDMQEMFAQMEPHRLSLLKAKPSLSIDPLRWTTDAGASHVVLTADLLAAEEEEDTTFANDFGLEYLHQANLAVEVSRAMAVQVAVMMQSDDEDDAEDKARTHSMMSMLFDQYASQLQAAGLVQIDGDKVSLNASYRAQDRSMDLNGQRMPLENFVMLMMRLL